MLHIKLVCARRMGVREWSEDVGVTVAEREEHFRNGC